MQSPRTCSGPCRASSIGSTGEGLRAARGTGGSATRPGPRGRSPGGGARAARGPSAAGARLLRQRAARIVARHLTLVFPRVDDCVSLFLNCGCSREEIVRDGRSFYLTKGWLCHDNPFDKDFDIWVERFGEERARRLRKAMVRSYEHVKMIDTGAYEMVDWTPQSQAWAEDLELEDGTVPGSVQLLERLLAGPWDSEIVVVPPGERITIRHLFEVAR